MRNTRARRALYRRTGLFHHVTNAARQLMEAMRLQASDFAYAVFHQPNAKFPIKAGEELGFTRAQMKTGLLVNEIGNTYAGSSVIGLTAVLDEAEVGDRILMVSFGSGAGSDAFCLRVTNKRQTPNVPTTRDYIKRSNTRGLCDIHKIKRELQAQLTIGYWQLSYSC